MMQMVETWWPLFLVALLLGIAIAWWLFGRTRSARVTDRSEGDVLDDGAAPAARNQALIDAGAVAQPPIVPPGVAGAGTAVAAAVEAQRIKAAEKAAEEPQPPPAAPTSAEQGGDDLTRIKGVGAKVSELLASLGVTRFAQIAAWNEADIDRIDAQLGRFQGRIRRDSWVEQATLLAADDTAGYEEKFGKL